MGTDWSVLGSGFTDVTMCQNGLIWGTDGSTIKFRTGIVDQVNNQGTGWEDVDSMSVWSINCGYRGRVWVVSDGNLVRRSGVNSIAQKGTAWNNL